MRRLYRNGYVVAMDDAGTEHDGGWVLVEDGLVAAVGGGEAPEAEETEDLRGALVAPGLVNTHHHLYQTLTRARAQQADLFDPAVRDLHPAGGVLGAVVVHGDDVRVVQEERHPA